MKRFGWREWVVLLAFLLTLTITGLFVARTVRRAVYWHNHQDEPIRPWMNVLYVSHSYRVPPYVLYQAIGLSPYPPPDRRPLQKIADEQHRPVSDLIKELENAITHARPPYTPPPPPPHPDDRGGSP
jgi:hypothetical protein